jgi:hypothetical protein
MDRYSKAGGTWRPMIWQLTTTGDTQIRRVERGFIDRDLPQASKKGMGASHDRL